MNLNKKNRVSETGRSVFCLGYSESKNSTFPYLTEYSYFFSGLCLYLKNIANSTPITRA